MCFVGVNLSSSPGQPVRRVNPGCQSEERYRVNPIAPRFGSTRLRQDGTHPGACARVCVRACADASANGYCILNHIAAYIRHTYIQRGGGGVTPRGGPVRQYSLLFRLALTRY